MKAKIEDLEFECTPMEMYELLMARANHISTTEVEELSKPQYDDCLDGCLITNKRFKEDEKVYFPWFNDQIGKFLVLDKHYKRFDTHSIMICKTYEEAACLCFCLNASINKDIRNRKLRIHQFEKIHEDEKLDRDTQTD